MIEIDHSLLEKIRRHAGETYPEECCGFLVGRSQDKTRIESVFETENVAPSEKGRRYLIGGEDFIRVDRIAESSGLEIIGVYHSHPGKPAVPSETDSERAWPGYRYLIVSLREGEKGPACRVWRLEENGKGWIEEEIYEAEGNGG